MKNINGKLNSESRMAALVTGASTGLGRFLALECAKRDFDLVLVALPNTGLQTVKDVLAASYKIDIHTIETDLSIEENILGIKSYCYENNITINFLINNAGIGFETAFHSLSANFCTKLIDVNIKATVLITRLFISDLQRLSKSYILNISSLASYTAMPYKSIYAASKSFIRCFTTALRTELKHTGVEVTTLCPGPIATNDEMRLRINSHGLLSRLACYDSSEIASLAISRALSGGSTFTPGIINKFNRFLMFILPELLQQKILDGLYASAGQDKPVIMREKMKAA